MTVKNLEYANKQWDMLWLWKTLDFEELAL